MRSYLLSGACAASMLLALSPVAEAADIAPAPAGFGWYLSVFGGWSMADLDISTSSSATITADVDLDDGFLAGLAVGAHFGDWLRGEVELSGHWHDAEALLTTVTGSPPVTATSALDGDADALFVLANLWFDLPMSDVVRPYAGGGVGMGRLSLDLDTTAGTSFIDDSDWAFAYQLGAGIAFDLSANFALDIGYRYKVIKDAELETETAGPGAGAELEVDYKSHNVVAGIRLSF